MATTRPRLATQKKPAVDARQAVHAATGYCKYLFRNVSLADFGLEEIEATEDRKYWLITLSFTEPVKNRALPDFLKIPLRKLKVFKVSAQTGEVVSMKMRDS